MKFGNHWYYFKEDGFIKTNEWIFTNGWFYCSPSDGHMYTGGWYTIDNKPYYFNPSGLLV